MMGVDYDAKAGYSVRIKNNLTEEYQTILECRYDGNIYEFIENELSEFSYGCFGSCYSDELEYYLCSDEQDVLKYHVEFNKFKDLLEQHKHILEDIEPRWFCELYIS